MVVFSRLKEEAENNADVVTIELKFLKKATFWSANNETVIPVEEKACKKVDNKRRRGFKR